MKEIENNQEFIDKFQAFQSIKELLYDVHTCPVYSAYQSI